MAALCSVPQPRAGGQSELRCFRNDFYDCLSARGDGLFDVFDAVCSPVVVGGIAHLSLLDGARRGHGGMYAAIAAIDAQRRLVAFASGGELLSRHAADFWYDDAGLPGVFMLTC